MDHIFDFIFNVAAHRIGVRVLSFLTGDQFKGDSGYAWGFAVVIGIFVMIVPFAAFIAWLIYTNGG